MTDEEIKAVVKTTVNETLTTLGFDLSNLVQIQEQQQFLRDFRKTWKSLTNKVVIGFVGLGVTGVGTLIALGIRSLMN